jgi:membrane protein
LEVEFIDRSIAIAGKAFVSFFPLVIVIAAFVPTSIRTAMLTTLVHRLGVAGAARNEVKQAFSNPDSIRRATGFVGLFFTFVFATSFTTALQRMFHRVWRRPSGGTLMGYARCTAWLFGFLLYLTILGALRNVLGGSATGLAVFVVVALTASVLAWTTTAWLMLQIQVRFVALLSTGLLCGVLMSGYAVAAPFWMPSQITTEQTQFGIFGIALALITWLSGAAACILIAATAGVTAVEDDGLLGRISRLGTTELLKEGAAPALPAPLPRTLASALSGRR